MALLEALNLKKYYGKGSYLVKAVDDISFGIDEGEFIRNARRTDFFPEKQKKD